MPVWRTALLSATLFGLNTVICAPLFGAAYLRNFDSNEGTFITFGKFLLDHFPHTGWYPLFNAGMPFENTYLPLTAWLTALGAWVARTSPAHAFHFLSALIYALAPVFLFLFARSISARTAPAFYAGLLWTLFSPSAMIPQIRADLGTPFGLRRLMNVVWFGETPHDVALCLLPAALLLIARYWRDPGPRRFAAAAVLSSAVMLANAFGLMVIAISAAMLFACQSKPRPRDLVSAIAILGAAYLLMCRFLPPSLIALIGVNSQTVAGDYRYSLRSAAVAIAFAAGLVLVWLLAGRLKDVTTRFALLFTACFGGLTVLAHAGIAFIPQPHRYQLEMEAGICLLAGFLIAPLLARVPRYALAVLAAGMAFVFWNDVAYARGLIHTLDSSRPVIVHQARWINDHLPGERIMVSGVAGSWFNLFASNPQLSAGHEPTAPNWMQRVAVYTIYSGQNAGARDAEYSIFWLKAFGCGAITVPGAASEQPRNTLRNSRKFDGVLPLLWREGDDSVYAVPLRTPSLAHVIPRSAIVNVRPRDGLDIDPARAYVAALDEEAVPTVIAWRNPDQGRIRARLLPDQVISVQMTYAPGWRARSAGKDVRVRPDQLGLMILEPSCSGDCEIDLQFEGSAEERWCLALSICTAVVLVARIAFPRRSWFS